MNAGDPLVSSLVQMKGILAPPRRRADGTLLRAVLVETDPAACLGLRLMLEQSGLALAVPVDFHVVSEALACIEALDPDLVILDPDMDGGGGLTLLRRMQRRRPKTPCLVRLRYEDVRAIYTALEASASAVVLQREPLHIICEAALQIILGRPYLSPETSEIIAAARGRPHPNDGNHDLGKLSGRELEIFRLLGCGQKTSVIARQLGIGVKSVQTHIQRTAEKLNIRGIEQVRRHAVLATARRTQRARRQ